MADVCITEFTDPGCPWAFSAEPFRHRLRWLYGDSIDWKQRMVVLAESPEEYEEKGFTREKMADSFRQISHEHGMPMDTRLRPRMAATAPSCRAIVATRLRRPERAEGLLRCLRVHHFSGGLLDDPDTIAEAARAADLDPAELSDWVRDKEVDEALREDMQLAREPLPAARALDHKLANWSGGRRYTCPSYEITRASDGVRISVPGFQPFAAYDVVLANLVPDLERRQPPERPEEVLAWTGTPLATKEVAVVMDIGMEDAREALGRVAVERHVGFDGFWTLA
jgi:predicted DsbA family dithiol-disulfide isomerase